MSWKKRSPTLCIFLHAACASAPSRTTQKPATPRPTERERERERERARAREREREIERERERYKSAGDSP